MFAVMVLSDLFEGKGKRLSPTATHVMKSQPDGVMLKVGVITIK